MSEQETSKQDITAPSISNDTDQAEYLPSPLHELHQKLGGKFVEFAGYHMPVHYPLGVMKEHLHCRAKAGLFDVSHMGQARLVGPDHQTVARALEKIVPSNILGLKPERMRYSVLLNEAGGIEDDLMITCLPEESGAHYGLVVNAACKTHDYRYLQAYLPDDVKVEVRDDKALLALQGPMSEQLMAIWCGEAVGIPFMSSIQTKFFGIECSISRCGYTGEDGYEIVVDGADGIKIANMILSHDDVKPIGLGARDSLRLEAGLCLYGHDIDNTISPIEAGLQWILSKRRRQEGGFMGEERIISELEAGALKMRVGLIPEGRAPAREGSKIYNKDNNEIGVITSGGFGPTVEKPIAMGYVTRDHCQLGTKLYVDIRGKQQIWRVIDMPFVPHRYFSNKPQMTTIH